MINPNPALLRGMELHGLQMSPVGSHTAPRHRAPKGDLEACALPALSRKRGAGDGARLPASCQEPHVSLTILRFGTRAAAGALSKGAAPRLFAS